MKAAVFSGVRTVEIVDVPTPEIGLGQVLIKVAYAGLCGSDITIYNGKNPRAKSPLIPGHEVVGEIAVAGEDCPFEIGTPVAYIPTVTCGECELCLNGKRHLCKALKFIGIQFDGGCAEYVKVPTQNIYPLPAGLAYEDAVLAEPLAVAVHAVRSSSLQVGDKVLVIGAGPIGLLVAFVARISGARVIVSEVSTTRVALAKSLDFETLPSSQENPVKAFEMMTGGQYADIVFECAGHPTAVPYLVLMGRPGAELVVVGAFKEPPPVDLFQLSRKEQKMIGSWTYTTSDFERALELLAIGSIPADKLVTHVFNLEKAKEAIELFEKGQSAVKVILRPF